MRARVCVCVCVCVCMCVCVTLYTTTTTSLATIVLKNTKLFLCPGPKLLGLPFNKDAARD